MSKYRVLSVRQPYANLICKGIKDVENRSRYTNYRGKLLIHASSKEHDIVKMLQQTPYACIGGTATYIMNEKNLIDLQPELNYSAIVGCCTVVDCVKGYPSDWSEVGVWNLVLKDAVWFKKPILNVKGKLGIWYWEGEIEEM